MATVNELALELLLEQGEATDDSAYVTQVETWINDSLQEIAVAINANPFRDKTNINTVAADDTYTLPAGAKSIIQLRYTDNGQPIIMKTIQELANRSINLTDTGRARFWIENGITSANLYEFKLYPIPDSILQIEAEYYFQPSEVASASSIPVQDHYIVAIKNRVRMYFAARDNKYDLFDRMEKRFEKNLAILANKEARQPSMMTYLKPVRINRNILPTARFSTFYPDTF